MTDLRFIWSHGNYYVRVSDVQEWLKELEKWHRDREDEDTARWLMMHNADFGMTVLDSFK